MRILNKDQIKALNLLYVSTLGTCDPDDLMGSSNASIRIEIMSGIVGQPVPKAKSGVRALRVALEELLEMDLSSESALYYSRASNFISALTSSSRPSPLSLEQAAYNMKRAVEFFDRVRAERVAVGGDHWDRLLKAARDVVSALEEKDCESE